MKNKTALKIMRVNQQMRRRIFIQTVFFAVVYTGISFAAGYWYGSAQAAQTILTELVK
jgi:hypothetical protein